MLPTSQLPPAVATRVARYCACGCRRLTSQARRTEPGYLAGEYKRFLPGHHLKLSPRKGRKPAPQTIVALKAAAAERMRARLRVAFGELSERELEIARVIHGIAFNRGYQSGRRKRTQAA